MKVCRLLFICFLWMFFLSAHAIDVALTVDDLPFQGDIPASTTRLALAQKMLTVFRKHKISGVYGMLNADRIQKDPDEIKILKEWVQSGNFLGNHTFSHMDLSRNSVEKYKYDIEKNEFILKKMMGKANYKFFRYPFLAEGNTQEKREQIRQFLREKNYKIAQVTMDFFDYEWNAPYIRCLLENRSYDISYLEKSYLKSSVESIQAAKSLSHLLFGRNIKYILLIHLNAFNVKMLDSLLSDFEKNGVHFISLQEALDDPVYQIDTEIVRERSYTFLNQVRLQRNLENPSDVKKFYSSLPEEKLSHLCVFSQKIKKTLSFKRVSP